MIVGGRSYVRRWSAEGRYWLEVNWQARGATFEPAVYRMTTRLDARRYRGRRIRLSAATKAPPFASGVARLFVEAGAGESRRAETTVLASEEWTRHAVELAVPRDARFIDLGFVTDGTRTSFSADDVRLRIVR